ncbi:MAG: helix-turn-helix transcriptional regulator [Casimicrobium sp.]
MRASRLLTLQMLLETRGRMSARELSQMLEVSLRTLYRDVDQLAAAGVPIYSERGRNGGFQLVEGWKTTLTGFTASEAQAVFMAGLAGPAAQLGLGREVIDAQLKLAASLPAQQRGDAQRVAERFHLDTLDWYREAEPVPHLTTVAAAVWGDKQISIRYESWKDVVRRAVHPLGLVLKAGAWYLVAARDGVARTYRISNIREIHIEEARATRIKKFDLASYWRESIERFETELYRGRATVLATPDGVKRLRETSAAVAKALTQIPPSRRRDGRVQLDIPIEKIELAATTLLRLAPEVEAIEPAALKAEIKHQIRVIAKCYGVSTQIVSDKTKKHP